MCTRRGHYGGVVIYFAVAFTSDVPAYVHMKCMALATYAVFISDLFFLQLNLFKIYHIFSFTYSAHMDVYKTRWSMNSALEISIQSYLNSQSNHMQCVGFWTHLGENIWMKGWNITV